MSDMLGYSQNCDYIIKEFSLHKEANIYDMFNAMTDGYKDLKDKLLVAESVKTEEPKSSVINLKQEKKRGRPRKNIN